MRTIFILFLLFVFVLKSRGNEERNRRDLDSLPERRGARRYHYDEDDYKRHDPSIPSSKVESSWKSSSPKKKVVKLPTRRRRPKLSLPTRKKKRPRKKKTKKPKWW